MRQTKVVRIGFLLSRLGSWGEVKISMAIIRTEKIKSDVKGVEKGEKESRRLRQGFMAEVAFATVLKIEF